MAKDIVNDVHYNNHTNSSAPEYITVNVGRTFVNCLLDTGAAYSICWKSILPATAQIKPTAVKLRGVTGSALQVVGSTTLNLKFKHVDKSVNFIVVEKLNNNLMILGRDFMFNYNTVISYKKLTFTIDDVDMPMIKISDKSSSKAFSLTVNKSIKVKPNASTLVRCSMSHKNLANNKASLRTYISLTGIVEPSNSVLNRGMLSCKHFTTHTRALLISY